MILVLVKIPTMKVTMGGNIRSNINRGTNTIPNDNKLGVYIN